MRSAILIFLAILTFATTPARAQGTWLETRMIEGICSSEASPDYQSDLRPPAAGTASLFLRDLDFGFGRRSPACAGCPWQASPTNQRPRCREKFRNAFSRQFAR